MVRQLAAPESLERGRDYLARGAVTRLTRRGDQIQAEVEGSSYLPYSVTATLTATGVTDASCTCPYDWGGACKHIVAALLACIETPEQIDERPPLAALLDALDRDQLRGLVLALTGRRPELADLIEAEILALQAAARAPAAAAEAPRIRRTALDPAAYRRQVQATLHSLDRMRPSEAYWHVGGVVDAVRQVAEQARPFIEAGDGRNALIILEAVTEEYVARWHAYMDGLLARHGRKYSLVPLLQPLR
jgi:uncharacterized Zn finger protein